MLSFMRRNQRLFFVIVTAVIIVSFSFFGTYQSFLQGGQKGECAFTAINGKKVTQRQLAQMILFLSTESDTPWGNPLNDGVLSKDLFESGIALALANRFQDPIEGELLNKAGGEARYTPYRHPYAPMLGAEWVWSSFAPEMKEGLEALKADLPFGDRFAKRASLYLAEKAFPQSSLKQMIRYQEAQASGLPQDGELSQRDLSLFGYHTLEDWFGRSFLSLSAQLITNGSILAEERGYSVSKKEAWADLIHNAELAVSRHPTLYSGSGLAMLDATLRKTGMTPAEAIVIWQRVLLFRRLFQDAGSAPLIDTLALERFSEYAGEKRQIAYYTLTGRPALKNGDDLLSFESYLDAVYQRDPSALAMLPSEVRTVSEVKQRAPELIYREWPLSTKEVNREALSMEIPIREVWNWQLQDAGWEALENRIPTLEKQEGEKFARLKALDTKNRQKADEMARGAILKSHPERILAALEASQARQESLKIPYSGRSPLKGVDPKVLMDRLEGAAGPVILSGEEITYEVTPLDSPSEDRVYLYAEAKEAGALRLLADRKIEEGYQARADKAKPLSQVREEVIATLTQSITRQLKPLIASHRPGEIDSRRSSSADPSSSGFTNPASSRYAPSDHPLPRPLDDGSQSGVKADDAAKMRFVPHLEEAKNARADEAIEGEGEIRVRAGDPLATQWEVERSIARMSRGQNVHGLSFDELTTGMLSDVYIDGSRGTTFFKVGEQEKGNFENPMQYDQLQKALSYEAQNQLFVQVLDEIEARGGMEAAIGGGEG